MRSKRRTFLRPYQAALRRYLKQGPAASLKPALRLGRKAVSLGLETLDLALVHEQAFIAQALLIDSSTARDRLIERTGTFFAQAIIPLEQTHRTALETNAHLSRLNRSLSRRTLDLAASNWLLKKEIARRRVLEETLRQSERHSGRLLEQSRHLQEQLRLLSRRVLSVQEEERKRISRELHDVIAQMLTGINVRLATLKMEATSNVTGIGRKISRTQKLVEKSVDIVHRFARELRPAVLDDLGLIPALHSFMKKFTKDTGIRIHFTAFTSGQINELDNSRRTALYRVAQEALTNVARHAHASLVDARIRKLPRAICMSIKDNGKSFDVERMWQARKSQHLGLLGMRERVEMIGGSFRVESAPGKGTTIHAQIPFNNGAKEHTRP